MTQTVIQYQHDSTMFVLYGTSHSALLGLNAGCTVTAGGITARKRLRYEVVREFLERKKISTRKKEEKERLLIRFLFDLRQSYIIR